MADASRNAASPRRRATYQDIVALPDKQVGEILHGELFIQPRPVLRHGLATSSLLDELVGPFQKGRSGPGGWVFSVEPELRLREHILVPDIAAWRRARLPRLPTSVGVETQPDWICEVQSPSTARKDRPVKRNIYHQVGVSHLWYVDPEPRVMEVFERTADAWRLIKSGTGDETVSVAPFSAISFAFSDLWPLDPEATDAENPAPETEAQRT